MTMQETLHQRLHTLMHQLRCSLSISNARSAAKTTEHFCCLTRPPGTCEACDCYVCYQKLDKGGTWDSMASMRSVMPLGRVSQQRAKGMPQRLVALMSMLNGCPLALQEADRHPYHQGQRSKRSRTTVITYICNAHWLPICPARKSPLNTYLHWLSVANIKPPQTLDPIALASLYSSLKLFASLVHSI